MSGEHTENILQRAERLKAQGRFSEAEAAYSVGLDTAPRAPELWWALGDLYARMEKFSGVERCCRKIINENQGNAQVWLYLGMALQRQGKLEEAESALQTSLRLNPSIADGLYQLGVVQQSLGKLDASIENYRKALAGISDPAPVFFNISVLLQRQDRIRAAFDHIVEAIQVAPGVLKYRRQFASLLNCLCPCEVSDAQLAEILRCFDTRGLDTEILMKPCLLLLRENPDIQRAVSLDDEKSLLSELSAGLLDRLSGNALLNCLLLHTKIASPEFAVLLRTLRSLLLNEAVGKHDANTSRLLGANEKFIEAMACQFFNTDYVAFVHAEEDAVVGNLAARLNMKTEQDEMVGPDFIKRLLVYCMYRPLSSLERITRLYETEEERLVAAIPLIVKRQWDDYRQESMLQDSIEALTPINAGVSMAVREQYEESPYPRWFSVDLYEPESCSVVLKTIFPYFDAPDFDRAPIDILVAGCGTGRHAIMVATRFAKSNVLAVDLSKTSLAYAKRKASEAGVSNIRFAQADILELGSLGHRFHLIESVGVLHHMQEPQSGLQILSDMLIDGGIMRLGLYSAYGRRAVSAAREYIAEQGFEATAVGIRAAREALLALNKDHPAFAVTQFRDFYTMSECRDLLFHVQEHCLRIPDLAVMLDGCGLEFIGFSFADIDVQCRYRACYPEDDTQASLSNWDEFERAHPATFEEMYQFSCQKPG